MKRLSILAASLALAASAQAATVSFQYGLPILQTTTEIDQTGTLGLFNASQGTLTGAVLQIFGEATTTISLTNNAAQAQNARATSFVNLAWSSTVGAVDAILVNDIAINFTTGAAQSYAVGQTRSFGPLADAGSFSYSLTGAALTALTGVGTFGINCASESGVTTLGGGGNVASSQRTQAGCGARIVYTFTAASTPVPEPTSLALVGLALAVSGFTASRRKA
jgi:PEP-CTERM motif